MRKINIIPDKSLYEKLGNSGYSIPEAIAELIDNSIDAQTDTDMRISIFIEQDKIVVADQGIGMNFEEIQRAITIAKSHKVNQLGQFGLGLKTACLSLGRTFSITSSKFGNPKQFSISFNVDEWNKNDNWEIVVNEQVAPAEKHYTIITISQLKTQSLIASIDRIKSDIQTRFNHYLNKITISVNKERIFPKEVSISPNTREEILEETPYGTIMGWVALMKEGSQKGLYGLHTYRNNRLIIPFNKIGFSAHPTLARIFGELHLDFVPVTHNKKSFEKESPEYRLVEHILQGKLKNIVSQARETKATEMRNNQVQEQVESWQEKTSTAMEKIIDHLPAVSLPPTDISPQITHLIQEGNSQEDTKGVLLEKIEAKEENPGKTKVLYIRYGHQKLSFIHVFRSLGINNGPKAWKYNSKDKLITIITNTDFPTYYACSDIPFIVVLNIADALAEFILQGQEDIHIEKYKTIYYSILKEASTLKCEF